MKQSSYKGKSPLPDFVIDAACAGNAEAVERVLPLQLHRLSDMITARERRLSSFNKEKNNAEMYIHLRIHISAFCLRS